MLDNRGNVDWSDPAVPNRRSWEVDNHVSCIPVAANVTDREYSDAPAAGLLDTLDRFVEATLAVLLWPVFYRGTFSEVVSADVHFYIVLLQVMIQLPSQFVSLTLHWCRWKQYHFFKQQRCRDRAPLVALLVRACQRYISSAVE